MPLEPPIPPASARIRRWNAPHFARACQAYGGGDLPRIPLPVITARGEPRRARARGLLRRKSLECRQALGDMMKWLLVDRVDRHPRAAKSAGIVERANFQDHRGQAGSPRGQMRAAFGAEFSGHGLLDIVARERFGSALSIAKLMQ